MTDEIDVIVQKSTNYENTDETVLNSIKADVLIKEDSHINAESVILKSQIANNSNTVSATDMTKNKDREHAAENDDGEKLSLDSENSKPIIENVECENLERNTDQNAVEDEKVQCPIEKSEEQTDPHTENVQETLKSKERELSVEEKERQSSVEEKSHPSPWSFSQWSENYESLEDERTIEEIADDPQKLILWAAEKNELDTLRRLLEEDPSLSNARDNDLYTPLHRASYSNNVEVIKILLSYDADISSKTTDGWEPLHCACKWDSVEAVSLLLQNGADVNARTKGNITPLHLAASNASGRRTLELLLWQPYIDPNIKNDAGDTAYDIAYRTGPLGALFEILEESVNVY